MATKPFPAGTVLLALIALALVIHAPVLGLSFFSDDFSVIHRIGSQGDLRTGSFFRPLPDWTLYLNYLIAGPTPWAFRIVNVMLLGFNSWLVYLIGLRLLPHWGSIRWSNALFAALLFVCYPFHNEPQLWIIGRSTALATTFTLLALVIALGSSSVISRYVLVGLCGALGALCYELALLLPLLLLAIMFLIPPMARGPWVGMTIISSAVAAMNLGLRSLFTGHVANDYGASFFAKDHSTYAGMAIKVLARCFLPPHPDPQVQTLRIGGLIAGISILGFLLWRRSRSDGATRRLLLVLVLLFGASSLIGVIGGVSTRTSESDRFLYLPSAFLCLFFAIAVAVLAAVKVRAAIVIAMVVLSLTAMRSNHLHWMEASSTIERIVQATPAPPTNARLLVYDLPGDAQGAFIFRHGYREALEFSGRDASGIRIVPEGPNSIWVFLRTETGDTLHRNDKDRWFDARSALQQPR